MCSSSFSLFFFFNDTATTEIYTLSLHDALPISVTHPYPGTFVGDGTGRLFLWAGAVLPGVGNGAAPGTLLEILPSQGITVATGEGALLLRRVQSAGVAEEPADVWALRRGMRPGVRLTEGA